ncbi:MAG: ankyrin repeat domain-containing protein [Phycisphaerales bacterium]
MSSPSFRTPSPRATTWTFVAPVAAIALILGSPLASAFGDDAKPQTPPPATAPAAPPATKPAAPAPPTTPSKPVRGESPNLTPTQRGRGAQAPTATAPVNGATGGAGAPQQDAPAAAPVIKFEPAVLDFGEMVAGVSKTEKIKIYNISDAPVTITKAIPGCGCTTPTWPKDPIPPGGFGEAEISLKPPEKQGVDLHKKVTFQLDGHPPVVLDLQGHVAEIVRIAPDFIDAPAPDAAATDIATGEITISSLDKTPLKIVGVNPPVVKDAGNDAALEHKVHIDWNAWKEQGKPAKLQFTTDHPKAPSLTVIVKRAVGDTQPVTPRPPVERPQAQDPLIQAVHQKDAKAVELLAAGGADVNKKDEVGGGRTALHWAVKDNSKEIVEVLLKYKANLEAPDRVGKTALAMAAESKDGAEMVKLLIEKGANVNARDQIGGSPLLWASGLGSFDSVKALIAKGADVNVVDVNGLTPLLWAAGIGSPDTVDALLKAGAKADVKDKISGDTALMRAARTGKNESVVLLIKAKADVNAANNSGQTAFMLAANSGSVEKLQAIKDAGANVKATCVRGWNAMDYAKNRIDQDRSKVIAFLEPIVQAAATSAAPAAQPAGGTATGTEKPADGKQPVAAK